MKFFEAYTQAKTLGRSVVMPDGDLATIQDLDSMDMSVSWALSDSWGVAEPSAVEVTEAELASAWDAAVASGRFSSVASSSDSRLFAELKKQLFS